MNKKLRLLTRTGIMLALVIVLQWLGKLIGDALTLGVGTTIVVGSLVYMVLFICVIFCGIWGAICVGALTPLMAFVIGQMAFPVLIPFIGLANVIMIVAFWGLTKLSMPNRAKNIVGMAGGTVLKVLYMRFLLVALLPVLGFNAKQIDIMSATYDWVQLVAALIGGIVAFIVFITLEKSKIQTAKEM